MALERVAHGADEILLVQQRDMVLASLTEYQLGLDAEIAALAWASFSQSMRSGVSASMTPPVRWRPQDWPEISSISL